MLKYLRIAVTALGLTACALLVALWVRSYYYYDEFRWSIGDNQRTWLESVSGEMTLSSYPTQAPTPQPTIISERITEPFPTKGFSFHRTPVSFSLSAPHWFQLFLFSALAIVPWLNLRFSLRTLLIATTLVAVGLGALVAMAAPTS